MTLYSLKLPLGMQVSLVLSYPETADVYVSQDGEEFFFVGEACKDTEFDISVSGLLDISYVKIIDTSNIADFGGNADGFDVDGVACLNAFSSESEPFAQRLSQNNIPDEVRDPALVKANDETEGDVSENEIIDTENQGIEAEKNLVTFPNPFREEISNHYGSRD